MSSLEHERPYALSVQFDQNDTFTVELVDGRAIRVPLEWFPILREASEKQRQNWQLIGGGVALHWPDIDEDIGVEGLLNPERTLRPRRSGGSLTTH